MPRRALILPITLLLLAASALPSPALDGATKRPDEVAGLVAWYNLDALHARLHEGDPAGSWPDSSGNGHHLIDEKNGAHAVFRTRQLNGKPALAIGSGNTHAVTDPFALGDHTIFLVLRAPSSRALFRSEADETLGVMLRDGGTHHHLQSGGPQRSAAYDAASEAEARFAITVLGRDAGVLKCFVNGAERSSGATLADPIRVGKFFHLRKTRFAESDGAGLLIAEMVFYDRYLSEEERNGVTRHLAEKFNLAPVRVAPRRKPDKGAVQAWLTSTTTVDLNQPTAGIAWDWQEVLAAPFRHDPKTDNTRLYCTRDGTRAHLWISVPLLSTNPAAQVRILLLKNGKDYVKDEGTSAPGAAPPGTQGTVVELITTVSMNAGDYLQVVASGSGAPGAVTLAPGQAFLAAWAETPTAPPAHP